MSGLLAVWSPNRPSNPAVLSDLTQGLSYRGDQPTCVLQLPNLGLGYCGLKLTEASEARIHSEGPLVLLLSGWILNRQELSRECHFQANTQEELVMEAYRRWGGDLCQHLIGEYALVLWDSGAQQLLAATDHFGTQPLFWARTSEGSVVICNCVKTMVGHPHISSRRNENAIQDFLVFSYQTDPSQTEYEEVKRIPGGHTLKPTNEGVKFQRYWHPPDPHYLIRKPEDTVEEFRHVFAQALKPRLESRALSFDLSGGIDSTTNLVMATEHVSRSKVQAITSVFKNSPDYEKSWAIETACALDVKHQLVVLDDGPVIHDVGEGGMNPLLLSFSNSPELKKYRVAQEFGPVLVSGDGGDPAFANNGWEDRSGSRFRRGFHLASALWQHLRVWGLEPPGLGLKRRLLPKRERPLSIAPWFHLDRDYLETLEERRFQARQSVRLSSVTAPFWVDLFSRRDCSALGLPIHVSFPFFDVRLWNFLNTVPPIPWFRKKTLGRLALRGRVSEAVVTRPKTNAAPLTGFYRYWFSRSRGAIERAILEKAGANCPYLDGVKLLDWIERVDTLPHALRWQLFASLAFLRWSLQEAGDEFSLNL